MKKNLLQPETRAEIIARIDKLSPEAKSRWGKMNVNQMLWHTNNGLKSALGEFVTTKEKPSAFKSAIMRFFIMKTDFPTPKAKAETFAEMNTVSLGIDPDDFNAEREELKKTLNRFPNAAEYAPESPLLGSMTKEEWARLQYGHLDHHLKQFGA